MPQSVSIKSSHEGPRLADGDPFFGPAETLEDGAAGMIPVVGEELPPDLLDAVLEPDTDALSSSNSRQIGRQVSLTGLPIHLKMLNFVERIVAHGQPARAAREAGYSEKYASSIAGRLLKRHDIQKEIEALRAVVRADGVADAKEIRQTLTEAMRDAPDYSTRIFAARELARIDGIYQRNDGKDAAGKVSLTLVKLEALKS